LAKTTKLAVTAGAADVHNIQDEGSQKYIAHKRQTETVSRRTNVSSRSRPFTSRAQDQWPNCEGRIKNQLPPRIYRVFTIGPLGPCPPPLGPSTENVAN